MIHGLQKAQPIDRQSDNSTLSTRGLHKQLLFVTAMASTTIAIGKELLYY
jgi:hypothetical protein